MSLNDLLKNIAIEEHGQIPLLPIYSNHKEFKSGSVFVAIRGTSFDGHTILGLLPNPFGLIVEDKAKLPASYTGPYVVVSSTRKALDILYHALNQFPSQKLLCVGVTGTNGKTTTTLMLEHLLNHNGYPTGVIGTIDHHFQDKVWKTSLTTPGSQEFYERLYAFVGLGAKALSVEVSSHALDQDRMSSTEFDIGIFTNLTRDHLDYHGTIEHYFASKEKLFSELLEKSKKKNKYAIINYDDEFGRKLKVGPTVEVIKYGLQNGDLRAKVISQKFSGQDIEVSYLNQKWKVSLPLVGEFNVLNFLATFGTALALKFNLQKVSEQFKNFKGVRGRMERVVSAHLTAQNKYAFVDYAHTPDALENVLKTLNALKGSNKIITVFGCGGDRDKGKRPLMGEIACRLSDFVFITSDNPRTEYPGQILEDITSGCQAFSNYRTEVDRKIAIENALKVAQTGDAILVAGKGHEDYQVIGKTTHPFSDVKVIEEFVK